ncbi:hypothetical protein [Blastococcus sp. Marseille-P5729]|uniref:hypothetical protein n=1 Tax=Blastococcus sp. Marseille-P5729 TaxID=2086582 RepID=UPI000D1039C5|nr:hypothetical protein [Blastococcus sp. Marseille-P5729]
MSTPVHPGHSHDGDDAEYEVVVPATPSTHPGPQVYGPGQPAHWSPDQVPPHQRWASYQLPPAPPGRWPEDARRRGTIPKGLLWGIGGLVAAGLVILLLVVTGVFTAKNDDSESDNLATGQYTQDDPGQQNLRIIDKESGISYDYLGEGWKDWTMGTMLENTTTVGEYIVTQPSVPSGGQFIAQVTSGPLGPQFGTPGPDQYPTVLAEVEDSVRGNYYPQPNTPTNQAEQEVSIDGHRAYQRSMDLTWDVEGYDSTGERVVLLLIDTGKSAPVLFYCSFPNTHAELYPLIEQVIASIKVDQ